MNSIEISSINKNTLRDLKVSLPKYQTIAISGKSGTGKNTFVKKILLSECQRIFYFTLPLYSRGLLNLPDKNDGLKISGAVPPVYFNGNSKILKESTVAEFLDIESVLIDLMIQNGTKICPIHNAPFTHLNLGQWVIKIQNLFFNKFIAVLLGNLSPDDFFINKKKFLEKGYLKVLLNEKIQDLERIEERDFKGSQKIRIVLDIIKIKKESIVRVENSLNKALSFENSSKISVLEVFPTFEVEPKSEISVTQVEKCSQTDCLISIIETITKDNILNSLENILSDPKAGIGKRVIDSIKLNGSFLEEILRFSLKRIQKFLSGLKGCDEKALKVKHKLDYLISVGVSNNLLNQKTSTLSSGEVNKFNFYRVHSQNVSNCIYIFESISQGYSEIDLRKIWPIIEKIKENGNTIVFLDHHTFILNKVDHIIDFVKTNNKTETLSFTRNRATSYRKISPIARYLLEPLSSTKKLEKNSQAEFLSFNHQAFNGQIRLPLAKLTIIYGPSGSGKTSLLDVIWQELQKNVEDDEFQSNLQREKWLKTNYFKSSHKRNKTTVCAMVLKVLPSIRELMAKIPESQVMGYKASDFGITRTGLRCESCRGLGFIEYDFKGFPTNTVSCSECDGSRFQGKIKRIKYKNLNFLEILDLSLLNANRIFSNHPEICQKLNMALKFELGSIKLGDNISNLSNGEHLKLQLAVFFSHSEFGGNIYFLDAPFYFFHPEELTEVIILLKEISLKNNTIFLAQNEKPLEPLSDYKVKLSNSSVPEKLSFSILYT